MTDPVDTNAESVERLAAFAMQGARYFESRPTDGEDRAFWANVTNAETMRRIATTIRTLVAQRAGWIEAFDRSTALRADAVAAAIARAEAAELKLSEVHAHNRAVAAFLARKGLFAEFEAWRVAPGVLDQPEGES